MNLGPESGLPNGYPKPMDDNGAVQRCQVSRILRDSPAFDLPVRKSSRIVKCPAKHRKPTKITFFADIGGISVLAVIRHYTATPAFTSTPLLRYLSDIDGNLC